MLELIGDSANPDRRRRRAKRLSRHFNELRVTLSSCDVGMAVRLQELHVQGDRLTALLLVSRWRVRGKIRTAKLSLMSTLDGVAR